VGRTSGRTVTSKVLAILGAFEDGPPTLSLTELAAAAAVPMPTAHRLVGELVEWGALRRDEHGRYRVGRRVWRIGQNAGNELRDAARRTLTDLFTRTGRSCQLAIRDDDQALVIDRLSGPETLRTTRAGDRLPLHTTAVGRVLLAYEEPWIVQAYLSREVSGHDGDRPVLPPAERRRLADELAAVRRRGHAVTAAEAGGGASVAVPVLADPGHAVAALAVVTPTAARARVARYVTELTAAARRIEPEARTWPNTRAVVAAFTAETLEAPSSGV
jgi:DNA-binding IclR family transcriptional regulator